MERKAGMALAAAATIATGIAWAQSSLTLPNNSAGTQLDTPPLMTPEAAAAAKMDAPPSRSDSSGAAFQKLDRNGNGYVSRSDFARMSGGNFDAADTNHDGRLSYDEFQHYWSEVQSGKD
jgi:hypothetical protein